MKGVVVKSPILWGTGLFALALSVVAPVQLTAQSASGAPAKKDVAHRYVVLMEKDPLATRFAQRNLNSSKANAAAKQLVSDQDAALKAVGKSADEATQSYTVALNGFATSLTDQQVTKLQNLKSVQAVIPDYFRTITSAQEKAKAAAATTAAVTAATAARKPVAQGHGKSGHGKSGHGQGDGGDSTTQFLGLSGKGGVWSKGYRGNGVVVGVIDTGVWPEHPSLRDDGTFPPPQTTMDPTLGNTCDFGNTAANPGDKPFTCNNKLIGAREVLDTYRSAVGTDPDEYDSARDDNGHGTHTMTTAAGDSGTHASIFGIDRGTVSGIAPRAQVIAYKALGNEGGFSSDLAAAIDDAVQDGVDVINYSVGGGASLTGADDIAFLFAADAGVFVATSAGNDGPGDATIGGPASVPWVTTVGASTVPRFFQGTVELGNHRKYEGASITPGTGWRPLVDAADAGSELCVPGKLDASKVSGAIVLCRRGDVGRAAKSFAVKQAGGAGMVLYNNDDTDNLFTDNHYVPSVHVDYSDGVPIKSYIAHTGRPQARLIGDQLSTWKSAPSMTIFSSRGPDPVAEDVIKPDLTAPGLQILAGASPTTDDPEGAPGQLFQAIAGTSMSSPHIAGALALLKQAHPDWSAAEAKSALMTTSYQRVVDNDRRSHPTPFAMGSGQVDMNGQRDDGTPFAPGLVYDAGFDDYLGFLCDAGPEVFSNPDATCAALAAGGVPTKAEDLNYPSIGIGSVPGTETVQRTVTSVSSSSRPQEYKVKVEAPRGFKVTVSPSRFTLAPGEKATYQVTVTNESAPVGEWRFGSLTWRGRDADVRSPLAVRGSQFDAPAEVKGSGDAGSVDIPIKFGYTGPYTAVAHGLVPATVTDDTVAQDPDQTFDPKDGFSDAIPITVDDADLLRIALPPDSVTDPNVDLDLYLFDSSGHQVASSTNGGTDEQIDVPDPANGTYTLYVHGWQTVTGNATYRLYDWVVPNASGGSLSITSAPTSATSGTSGTVTASWTGAGTSWNLGSVSHEDGAGKMGRTIVEVDNRP